MISEAELQFFWILPFFCNLGHSDFMTTAIFVEWCRFQWIKTLHSQSYIGHLFFTEIWYLILVYTKLLSRFLAPLSLSSKLYLNHCSDFLFYRKLLSINNYYIWFYHSIIKKTKQNKNVWIKHCLLKIPLHSIYTQRKIFKKEI